MRYLLLAVLFITSCNPDLKYGTITKMIYHPSYSYCTTTYIQVDKTTIPLIQWWEQGESWSIKVKGVTKSGDTGIAEYYIPKPQWDTLNVGDFLCVDGLCKEDTALKEIKK